MLKYKVFVINLERSTQRLADISDQLQKQNIDFERIDAVDGRLLTPEQIEQVSPSALAKTSYHRQLGLGEIGCALSHKKAWQQIIDQQLDFAIVLEDDIKLADNFNQVLDLFINLPKSAWDFVKLYPLTRSSQRNIRQCYSYKEHEFVTYHKFPLGLQAQVISYQGAVKMVENMPYILQPVDGAFKAWWELDITPFGLMPYCVKNDIHGESDINPGRGLEKMPQRKLIKLKLNWSRALVRLVKMPTLDKAFDLFTQKLK